MNFAIAFLALTAAAGIDAQATGFYRLNATTALNASRPILFNNSLDGISPYDVAPGLSYKKITDRFTLNATGKFPNTFTEWDMMAFAAPEGATPGQFPNATDFIFIPAEANIGGGLFRYNVKDGSFALLAVGKGGGDAARNPNPATFNVSNDEFPRIDPATFTPFGTVLFAEETTGMFPLLQPPLGSDSLFVGIFF